MRDQAIEMVGFTVGRLVVVGRAPTPASGSAMWYCECRCGVRVAVLGVNLRRGRPQSCGCLRIEAVRERLGTHLLTHSREYVAWRGMRHRCSNPRAKSYRNYGGRGIKVCPEWDRSFEQFLADVGPAPDGHSLDRIDNNGDYRPGNCRWATMATQLRNRRNSHIISFGGKTMNLVDWAKELGVSTSTIRRRMKSWPMDRALANGGAR